MKISLAIVLVCFLAVLGLSYAAPLKPTTIVSLANDAEVATGKVASEVDESPKVQDENKPKSKVIDSIAPKAQPLSTTLKPQSTTEEDDEDEYADPDTDDGLSSACIASLCGIGK